MPKQNPVEVVINPIAFRMAKIVYNFGHSECNRVARQLSEDTWGRLVKTNGVVS